LKLSRGWSSRITAVMFGNWEHKTVDLVGSVKALINRVTGQVSEDPFCRPVVYERTPWRFAPLVSMRRGPEELPGDGREACGGDSGSACGCYSDTGLADGFSTQPSSPSPIVHDELLEGDGRAMLLRNILSPSECCELIEQAEGFGLRSCGYSQRIRITDRVSVMGEDLAAVLFERVRPYLDDIEVWRDSSGVCWPPGTRTDAKSGMWSPVGLNPCFRVCRYEPGGFFLPHFDGGFGYTEDHLSLKTFMLYLNDAFEGAPTTFYNHEQQHYKEPDPANVVYELHPERGACTIFNHMITHDGGTLVRGQKYILRSEVMYRWHGEA